MITITLTDWQANVVSQALDFYGRSFLGQLTPVHCKGVDTATKAMAIELTLKAFMGLKHGEYMSPNGNEVPEEARIALDIHDSIRHFMFTLHDPEDPSLKYHRSAYPPPHYSTEPLPEIKGE